MDTNSLRFPALCLAALLAGGSAAGLEVKLQVTETEKVARNPAVVTAGVPFAKGEVKDVAKLAVTVGGKAAPAQFLKTVPWDDGSVRWALMDVQADVPAGGKADLVVTDSGANPAPAAPVKVEDGAEAVKVSTGPLQFTVSKKKAGLFESLKVDGKELVTPAGRGLVLFKEGGGEVVAGAPTEVKVEQAGPMRAIVCVKGKFPEVHKDLLGYTARISTFAGRKHVKVHLWIENGGAMGYFRTKKEGDPSPNVEWLPFKGLAVELGLGLGEGVRAGCEGVEGAGGLKVLQICKRPDKNVSQGPFYTWKDFQYTVTSAGKELKKGDRTDGVVELKGDAGKLTAAIRGFWENYEKAIELDGGKLKLWLWPTEGIWPRPYYWIRYGIDGNILKVVKDGMYMLPGAVHKGHEFILDFSGRDAKETSAELSAPLFALAAPEYYAATEAAPGLFAPPGVRTADKDCNAKLAAWERMGLSLADPANPNGLWKARQVSTYSSVGYTPDSTQWYGWMDFGDLFVDGHGQVHLSYDWTWVTLLGAMRTGNMNFLRLASEMARHRIDVDQLWSDRELPECRGLQRPGGSGCSSYHCSWLTGVPGPGGNWLAGVVAYYMLTGEPKALECCARNAEGLKAAWEWVVKTKPWAGPQGDMATNAWSISCFCAMYDLTADKQWLDEAMKLFNANVTAKWKGLGPHLHDGANQIQSQDYIQEDMKYCYAIAALCDLHRRTGDENLFKLLKEGCEKPFPDSFFEAPLFLSDLFAYVGYKTKNAEYLAKAADLFAQSFPESKCPPVFMAGNSTWFRTSAMTLRTGQVLQYVNWKLKTAK